MPEICRFYGIVIRMYYDDHEPAHFHAQYGRAQVTVAIGTLAVIAGALPPRALGLVAEWAAQHHSELVSAWNRAKALEVPGHIDPLP
ncbi:MAG: transcriptional regulator [Sulfobacillus benefaciens]|uniref:Transcriptional regulator n=1 Tax=Sulfobacillus benefaciens TaxID=453960 RepID=A0A2T2WU42_9FIRM|nr:MAG: transcriptional regulator [Sulfobacillus benefaciens]